LRVLELYAGSGAMGLEALSQGAATVTFVEKARKSIEMIEDNLKILGVQAQERAKIIHHEADRAIPILAGAKQSFDLVFLDPPYYQDLAEKTLQMLGAYDIVNHSGYVVVQHFKKDRLSRQSGPLTQFKQTKYGDTVLSFYEAESNLPRNL
jgi:16S rRNA (guanine966-N2)-methyltransferase